MRKGTIAVQTENIFPIIKKFLYADHDIFLRELVSNAVDATTKLKVLANGGHVQGEIGDTTIEIILNPEAKTLTISDKGIGMTEAEVLKYLNQIAFSSASEFLEKYKDSGIIGHFGLGFYSAFMVSAKVEVVTKSYQTDSPAVRWICDGSPEYSLEDSDKMTRGTDIVLHISDEEAVFLERERIDSLLNKYCKFLPVPIVFGKKTEYVPAENVTENQEDEAEETEVEVPNIINAKAPIWKKSPSELSDGDYLTFYRDMFPMAEEPMFWIHLNIDYPFNLTGVLYFPKLGNAMEVQRNKIHLYSNQVYVTDDVREIVPEWLLLLHGVIDSPDIPLNVSRSYLQSDGNVKKINTYITKKVGDKLQDLYKADRKTYESKWSDLGNFVKYGTVSDEKFAEKSINFSLFENTKGEFFAPAEYVEKVKEAQTDKHGRIVVLYTHNPGLHDALIKAAQKRNYDVLKLTSVLDTYWLHHLEAKGNLNVTFARLDSASLDELVQKDENRTHILNEGEQEIVKGLFTKATDGEKLKFSVELKPGSPEDMPVSIVQSEFMRRMIESQMNNQFGDMRSFAKYDVLVNANHPVVANKLLSISDPQQQEAMAHHLTDLALLQCGLLDGERLTGFLEKSVEFMK